MPTSRISRRRGLPGTSESHRAAAPRRVDDRKPRRTARSWSRKTCATISKTATSGSRSTSRRRSFPRLGRLPDHDRQRQRAQHGRADLDLPGEGESQHRRPAEQVLRRHWRTRSSTSTGRYRMKPLRSSGRSTACWHCEILASLYPERTQSLKPRVAQVWPRQIRKTNRPSISRRFAKRIDAVDRQIQALINERARYAQQVGITKGELAAAVDYYRPEREAEVLRAVLERNEGPTARRRDAAAVPRDHVGLPRTAGAAEDRFPGPGRHVYANGGLQAFRALGPRAAVRDDRRGVPGGRKRVPPISASCRSRIRRKARSITRSTCSSRRRSRSAARSNCASSSTCSATSKGLDAIERICAHEQSLAQCRGWLREYLPHVELIGVSSNAAGARRARDEKGTAAIGGEAAAEVYDLKIMVNNIEDSADNSTRFLVVGRELLAPAATTRRRSWSRPPAPRAARACCTACCSRSRRTASACRGSSPARRGARTGTTFSSSTSTVMPRNRHSRRRSPSSKEHSSLFRIVGAYPESGQVAQPMNFVVEPSAIASGTVTVPGDKSISHRAIDARAPSRRARRP